MAAHWCESHLPPFRDATLPFCDEARVIPTGAKRAGPGGRPLQFCAWAPGQAVRNMRAAPAKAELYFGAVETQYHEHHELVDLWRAAKRVLLFTPAPDRRAIELKQRQLKDRGFKYMEVEPGELKRAIDKHVTWLNTPRRAPN